MANRKSWRRAAAPQPAQVTTRLSAPAGLARASNPPKSAGTAAAFVGVSDASLSAVLAVLLAKEVSLRVADGGEYRGLFAGTHRPSSNSEICLVLRYAQVVRSSTHATVLDLRGETARMVRIPVSLIVSVTASRLEFDAAQPPSADPRSAQKASFATDGEISRGASGVGRQLQRFDDFGAVGQMDQTSGGPMSLDEQTFGGLASAMNGSRPGKKWDQFQVNEDKFGVKTSFDEDEYTTKIDRDDANYADRQREAARLASEIESKSSDNIHMREERNQALGADYDEESMYSGVQRPMPAAGDGKSSTLPPSDPTPQPKPAAIDKPKLSYAAAAAISVKATPTFAAPTSANTPGAAKQASLSKPIQPSKQLPVSKVPAAAKQPQAAKQAATLKHPGTKPLPSAKHVSGPRHIPAKHQTTAKQQATGKQTPASKQPFPAKSQLATKHQPTSKQFTTGKQVVTKQYVHTKQPTISKQVSGPKQGTTPKPTQTSKQQTTGLAVPNSNSASAHEKHTSYSSAVSASITESKEREAVERKAKSVGARDRSSRENMSQLVKVRSSITGRTSPNQSRNSPAPTPAATDTSAVAVLNLDAQTPNFGPEQIKRFEEFKTNREIQSIAENREKITDDLKKFSTQLDSRNRPLRRDQVNKATNGNASNAAPVPDKKATETTAKIEEKPKTVTKPAEQSVGDGKGTVVGSEKGSDAAAQNKPRVKSKLNPNAQEFKFNPDAPSFEPPSQKQVPANPAPQAFNTYPVGVVPAEYSQAMHSAHQPYPVPVQAMGQIPYGQAQYGVIMPSAVPSGMAPNNPAYQFIQGPPGSFPGAQVASRFPQSAALPASYSYPHMSPTMPMVLAPGPGPQRVPPGPYAYYGSGPYGAAQVPGGAQMPQPPQQAVYAAGSQQGVAHLQGGMGMTVRGGHGHQRRGGGGRRGSKHHNHHSTPLQANGVNSMDKGPLRGAGAENPMSSDLGQR